MEKEGVVPLRKGIGKRMWIKDCNPKYGRTGSNFENGGGREVSVCFLNLPGTGFGFVLDQENART